MVLLYLAMVVGNNKSTTTRNVGESLACGSTTRGTSLNESHPGLHLKPLDATIGQVPAPYCTNDRHG
jgi:hypothetical protein